MEGADPRTDGELLVATVQDPEAFATFYRRHVRGMLAFFRRRAGSAELALDLTAETFAAALEASSRYELRPEPARSWLYGIAWNKLHGAPVSSCSTASRSSSARPSGRPVAHDVPIATLERELVTAARRLGAGEEKVSLPGARRHPVRRHAA